VATTENQSPCQKLCDGLKRSAKREGKGLNVAGCGELSNERLLQDHPETMASDDAKKSWGRRERRDSIEVRGRSQIPAIEEKEKLCQKKKSISRAAMS